MFVKKVVISKLHKNLQLGQECSSLWTGKWHIYIRLFINILAEIAAPDSREHYINNSAISAFTNT